jgi:XTP/dITP diphosphohydrolase
MRLYLASGNPHKASELQALADALPSGGPPAEIVSAAAIGGMPHVDEDTGTFVGNARKKALALRALLPEGGWALADDSGLCVAALGGAPGVESAYFAGPGHDPAANLAKLVAVMAGVPEAERAAEFVCVLFLAGPVGVEAHFEGHCPGSLSTGPRGKGGFGYDPLFIPEGFVGTLAELPPEVKARVGHRGRAWAACAGWLAARG